MPECHALHRLVTERLVVRPATEADVPAVVTYYRRNRQHLLRVDPLRPESFYTEDFWYARVRQDHQEIRDDRSLRLFLFPAEDAERVIGIANFTQFVRGVAQYCTLGYAIDRAEEGKGLMHEALTAAIGHIFGPMRFHRIQARRLVEGGARLREAMLIEADQADVEIGRGALRIDVDRGLIVLHRLVELVEVVEIVAQFVQRGDLGVGVLRVGQHAFAGRNPVRRRRVRIAGADILILTRGGRRRRCRCTCRPARC